MSHNLNDQIDYLPIKYNGCEMYLRIKFQDSADFEAIVTYHSDELVYRYSFSRHRYEINTEVKYEMADQGLIAIILERLNEIAKPKIILEFTLLETPDK